MWQIHSQVTYIGASEWPAITAACFIASTPFAAYYWMFYCLRPIQTFRNFSYRILMPQQALHPEEWWNIANTAHSTHGLNIARVCAESIVVYSNDDLDYDNAVSPDNDCIFIMYRETVLMPQGLLSVTLTKTEVNLFCRSLVKLKIYRTYKFATFISSTAALNGFKKTRQEIDVEDLPWIKKICVKISEIHAIRSSLYTSRSQLTLQKI